MIGLHNNFCGNKAVDAIARKEVVTSMYSKTQEESGKREVFCRFIRRAGKIIYPKNGTCFHFFL